MHLYLSGTPKNDRFQVIENQMCSHRLFSLYRDYQSEVFSWLRDVKSGIQDFDDYCAHDPSRIEVCADADLKMQHMLRERGIAEEWPGYHATLSDVSETLPGSHPKYIMLDSGAFTAWNTGAPVSLDDVKSVYERFLTEADGFFEEVWLINLDVITESSSPPDAKQAAMQQSDRNLAELRSEFGQCVLPVFHQDEGQERLLEVVDQANGYLCLSPNNKKPEEDRWRWAMLARSALSDLDCSVRTHGLATTGNHMIRNATLYSGDSEAWTRHARYGVVDLIEAETTIAECPITHSARTDSGETIEIDRYLQIKEVSNPRYKGYHIGAERNDWNRKTNEQIIDNAKHFSHLGIINPSPCHPGLWSVGTNRFGVMRRSRFNRRSFAFCVPASIGKPASANLRSTSGPFAYRLARSSVSSVLIPFSFSNEIIRPAPSVPLESAVRPTTSNTPQTGMFAILSPLASWKKIMSVPRT